MHLPLAVLFLLCCAALLPAQVPPPGAIRQALDKNRCTTLRESPVEICRADYKVDGRAVEALRFVAVPAKEDKSPAVLLIPGYQRTAYDQTRLGAALAGEGMVALAVTQPGFGESQGPADFVGPFTLKVMAEAFDTLRRDPAVDPKRIGIYGYSRGGMAASLLATSLDGVKAAVFGAGVYDFQRAHDEVRIPGIRENMQQETGMTGEAVRARSSILRMDRLSCSVLILHGDKDENVPVSQAILLGQRLKELGKDFDLRIFPGRDHGIGPEVLTLTVDFFRRKL